MSGRPSRIVIALVSFLTVYMVVTLILALSQDSMRWDWWWTVPVGVLFVTAVIFFRVLVQRSQDAAERADRETDAKLRATHRED